MSEPNPKANNLTWHHGRIQRADREALLRQQGCVVWLTGLSGCGKSTIACALEERLVRDGHAAFVLDGDNIRHGLNSDLGFSAEEREENIRRIGHVAALFADAGMIVITAFISPYEKGRDAARQAAGADHFLEVYLRTPLAECEKRDPKGLYKKARAGEIADFTGIDAPYEEPKQPALVLETAGLTPFECVEKIVTMLRNKNVLHEN